MVFCLIPTEHHFSFTSVSCVTCVTSEYFTRKLVYMVESELLVRDRIFIRLQ